MFAAALTSILAGGATGLLGMFFQRMFDGVFQYFKAKQDLAMLQEKNKQEILMKQEDAKIMTLEWAGKLKVAEKEGETAENVKAAEGFNSSLLREPERYSNVASLTKNQNWWLVVLDVFRGSIRPLLTAYLCGLTTYIWIQVSSKLAIEDLDADQVLNVWLQVVNTILYLWTTVTLWWFGTRNQNSAPKPVQIKVVEPTPLKKPA